MYSKLFVDDDALVRLAAEQAASLPAGVRDRVEAFRVGSHPSGSLLLRGLPVGELPPTPAIPTEQTDKTNAREVGANSTVIAGAAYRVRGIDLGVAGKISDKWSIFGGLVLMESKVLQSISPAQIGAQLANIAHQSFNVLTKYRITDPWEIGGQATFASKIYGGTFGAINGNALPSHWRFDAFTEYKLNKQVTAKLSVNNLLDTVYYDAFYRSNSPFVFIAPGRSVWMTISGKL